MSAFKLALLGGLALLSCAARSQDGHTPRITGFPGETAAEELALEEQFTAGLDAANLRMWLKDLSAIPHPGGSPASRDVASYIAQKFDDWGLDVKIETFYGLAPTPEERVVEMIAPYPYKARLTEQPVNGDAPKDTSGPLPPFNAYSKDADVTAPAVYVNYGLPEDYEILARHGVDVRGKIVIARLGAAFRGVKPRLASERGAVGAILYSDPADVGYGRGPVYPEGPFLPETSYQYGSVLNIPLRAGDPLTAYEGATKKPSSFSLTDAEEVLSPIPVLPLSASDVRPILASMAGEAAPPEWRGALPVTYRFGGGVTLRLKVAQNWKIASFHNVVATLEGSTWPDEWIIHGNNHDSWGYGAMVALSGLVTLMEEARGIAELTKTGWRPKRTLVFAAWDGEEHGLLGSTEWVETHAKELREKAVVYVNTGVNLKGFLLAGGSHSLEALVHEVARDVKDPRLGVSIFDRKAARIHLHGSEEERNHLTSSGRFRLEPLGLASDHTPFLHHLGVPSLDLGFGDEAPTGVYHSIHDNFDSYERFGDPGFHYGEKLAEVTGRTMLRLTNAELLPFDYRGMVDAISQYAQEIEELVNESRKEVEWRNTAIDKGLFTQADDPDASLVAPQKEKNVPEIDFSPLERATSALSRSAQRFVHARNRYEKSSAELHATDVKKLNAILAHAEHAFAPKDGLPGRPWYRHHLYAPGYDIGYGAKTIPSIREAAENHEWAEVTREIPQVAELIEEYAARINDASKILEEAAPL